MFLHYEIYVVLEVLHLTQNIFLSCSETSCAKLLNKIDIQKAVNVFIWKLLLKSTGECYFRHTFRVTQWRSKR